MKSEKKTSVLQLHQLTFQSGKDVVNDNRDESLIKSGRTAAGIIDDEHQ